MFKIQISMMIEGGTLCRITLFLENMEQSVILEKMLLPNICQSWPLSMGKMCCFAMSEVLLRKMGHMMM